VTDEIIFGIHSEVENKTQFFYFKKTVTFLVSKAFCKINIRLLELNLAATMLYIDTCISSTL